MKIEHAVSDSGFHAWVVGMPNANGSGATPDEAAAHAVREALSVLYEHLCLATITVRDTGGVEIHWPEIAGVTDEPVSMFVRTRSVLQSDDATPKTSHEVYPGRR